MIEAGDVEQEPADEQYELHPEADCRNQRLDRFIVDRLPALSRSYVHRLLDEGHVRVDGMHRKASFKVTPGELVTVNVPFVTPEELVPEDIPLDVLYEDDDVIVVNKRARMVVRPAPGHPAGTIVNALLYHAPEIAASGVERGGIVHRLDKDTSGVMIAAKHDDAARFLMDQWQHGSVGKRYIALAQGALEEDEAVIDVPVARHRADRKRMGVDREGRSALTIVTVRERFGKAMLLDIDLRTGRTHQIRVHLAFIKHPVLGDTVYGTPTSIELSRRMGIHRQQLHAAELTVGLPSGDAPVTFAAPIPEDMRAAMLALREED